MEGKEKVYIVHESKVPIKEVKMYGSKNTYIQWLIPPEISAGNFVMRKFTLKPNGEIPKHKHWYEHEIYVLKGRGVIGIGDKEYTVEKGYVAYIPPNVLHWYRNIGEEDWEFICVIPLRKIEGRKEEKVC